MAISEFAVDKKLIWRQNDNFYTDYNFLRLLGSGVYGEVFLVQHKSTRQLWAAKILSYDKLANDATYLKKLAEPTCNEHVSCYHDHFLSRHPKTDENSFVILIEYLDGPTLEKYKAKHPYAVWGKRIPKLLHGLLEGLAYMHSRGVVHGDIKPRNLVFRNGGDISSVVFVDFGLACSNDCDEKNVGSLLYHAPELFAQGSVPTKASDVWATATSIYDMFLDVSWLIFGPTLANRTFDEEAYNAARKAMQTITLDMETKYVDVLDRMLVISPENRITAQEALAYLDNN